MREQLRRELFQAYGGKCQCCGEEHEEFLTIDHVNGHTGASTLRQETGWAWYRWLQRQGYPQDGYRLLCYNCNCSRGHRGYCRHERERSTLAT